MMNKAQKLDRQVRLDFQPFSINSWLVIAIALVLSIVLEILK